MERGTIHRPQHTPFKRVCPSNGRVTKWPPDAVQKTQSRPKIRITPNAQGQAAAGTQGPLPKGGLTWRVCATDIALYQMLKGKQPRKPRAHSQREVAHLARQCHGSRIIDAQGQAAAGTQSPLLKEGVIWRVSATDSHHIRCSRAGSRVDPRATHKQGHLARQCHGYRIVPKQKVFNEKCPQRNRPE